MHVEDVSASLANRRARRTRAPAATRWQRSMDFLRLLGDSLSWNDDRMALTVFAHIATPQIRLTNDPNTVFFFLDHLHDRPPFRLEDDTTWDTNLEQGIAWGLRLIEKDQELHGAVAERQVVRDAVGRRIVERRGGARRSTAPCASTCRCIVIGVGTLAGGDLPETTIDGVDGAVAGKVAPRSRVAAAHCRGRRRAVLRARSRSGSRHRQRDHRRGPPAGAGDHRRRARSRSCTGDSSRRPRVRRARRRRSSAIARSCGFS